MNNLVKDNANTLARYLEGREGELVKALRGLVDPQHFARVAITLYRQGGKGSLIKCSPESVLASLFEGAQLGLSPDPHLGEFWLIPRSGKATFQIGVQGLVKLARRSGEVLSIKPVVVYRGDEFMLRLGSDDHRIDHVPSPDAVRDADNLIAAYAVAKLESKSGTISTQFEHMFRSDVDASRKKGGDVWRDHYVAMAKVRVVARLCKWLPKTDELAIALHRDMQREMGIEPESVIQVEPESSRGARRTIRDLVAESESESEPEQRDVIDVEQGEDDGADEGLAEMLEEFEQ